MITLATAYLATVNFETLESSELLCIFQGRLACDTSFYAGSLLGHFINFMFMDDLTLEILREHDLLLTSILARMWMAKLQTVFW